MKLYKILHAIFLIVMMISCSQETVINKSITEKLNAPDTKMCIDIVTEKSRTVRPAVTKWEITVTNKEEENNLEYSKTVDSKTTSVTFINIVATATYTVEVHGLDEDGNKILSGAKEKVQIEANKVNICNVTVSDDFEADGNGTLKVTIDGLDGLDGLGIQENSSFTLEMSGLTNSNNSKNVELTYKDGVLSGLENYILPGSYKISIADFPVNVIQDPIVNIYPGAVTTIDWTWNYNDEESQKQVGDNIKQKNTLIPVWNKNADGGDSVGLIGANGLFVTPTWENGTFVACDVDTAGDMWTLTITEKELSGTDEYGNEVYNYTYKLTNEHAKESYYFKYCSKDKQIVDFCVAEIDLEPLLSDASNIGESKNDFLMDNFGKTKLKTLFLLENVSLSYCPNIYNCFIEQLPQTESDIVDFDTYFIRNFYFNISSPMGSAIEVTYEDSELYMYVAGTRGYSTTSNDFYYSYHQNIYKERFSGCEFLMDSDTNEILKNNCRFYIESILEVSSFEDTSNNSGSGVCVPILTLDMGDYFTYNEDSINFFNEAFKISDMHVVGNDLYITAGCVSYNKDATDNHQYFSYSFGGLFRYENVSMFYYDGKSEEYSFPEGYSWNDDIKKVEGLKINHVYGLKEMDNQSENVWIVKNEQSGESLSNTLIGLTQAETNDSLYFAGPRYIIPSDDKLFIIDSGFYGEYEKLEVPEGTQETEMVIFSLKDKRNRIFTFDTTNNSLSFSPIDDGILFDYDYITETENYDEAGTLIPVSW